MNNNSCDNVFNVVLSQGNVSGSEAFVDFLGWETTGLNLSVLLMDFESIKRFLELGSDPTRTDSRGHTPLMYAVRLWGFFEDLPADFERFRIRSSPYYIYKNGDEKIAEIIKLLFSDERAKKVLNGNHPFISDLPETFLEYAMRKRNLALIKVLLDCGADPNECEENGYSHLMNAVMITDGRRFEIAVLLLSRGANPDYLKDGHDFMWYLKPIEKAIFCEEWTKTLTEP